MIITLFLLFTAVIGLSTLLSNSNTDTVIDEYCRLECKECKIQDYSICC